MRFFKDIVAGLILAVAATALLVLYVRVYEVRMSLNIAAATIALLWSVVHVCDRIDRG